MAEARRSRPAATKLRLPPASAYPNAAAIVNSGSTTALAVLRSVYPRSLAGPGSSDSWERRHHALRSSTRSEDGGRSVRCPRSPAARYGDHSGTEPAPVRGVRRGLAVRPAGRCVVTTRSRLTGLSRACPGATPGPTTPTEETPPTDQDHPNPSPSTRTQAPAPSGPSPTKAAPTHSTKARPKADKTTPTAKKTSATKPSSRSETRDGPSAGGGDGCSAMGSARTAGAGSGSRAGQRATAQQPLGGRTGSRR